jgi:hypothetical protein
MSRVTSKSRPLPTDEISAAQEVERRESLAANESHTARVKAAEALELSNRRGELTASFSDLQRMKTSTGNLRAAHDGYNRVYARIERLARVIAGVTGESLEVPEFDPPQILSTRTRVIGPPVSTAEVIVRDDCTQVTVDTATAYRERGSKGAISPAIPGSAADRNWPHSQERGK